MYEPSNCRFPHGYLSLFQCLSGEEGIVSELGLTNEVKLASSYTAEINSAVYSMLDFEDTQETSFAVRGLIDAPDASLTIEEQLTSGKIPIIVPQGFAEHAIAENVYAGKAMNRRANYQYGVLLEPGVTGKLAQGIGMGQSTGTVSYLAPTYEIKGTGTRLVIDGIEMEFQLTPGTEDPAEMNTYFPQFKALWVAEITNTIVYGSDYKTFYIDPECTQVYEAALILRRIRRCM